jgi:uncharacterized protein YndB with AHSA1/START domain
MQACLPPFDPALDLMFERLVDIPPAWVWAAWTRPEHIVHWFTPAPWKTIDCEIDLRPGGLFRTTMRSPEGQDFPNLGCYLHIAENEQLIWTNALHPGFRPGGVGPLSSGVNGDFDFTAAITLAPHENGTRYTARVIHREPEARDRHADMGFEKGWGTALDQLVAHMREASPAGS